LRFTLGLFIILLFIFQGENEALVLSHLSDCVMKHKGLSSDLSSTLVQFMVRNVSTVFSTPDGLYEKVNVRIQAFKLGKIPKIKGEKRLIIN